MSEHTEFGLELFWREASAVLDRVIQTQQDAIRRVGTLFADCIEQDGIVHAYGTGHSQAFAMELAGRAGGLAAVSRMDLADLALPGKSKWTLEEIKRSDFERNPEVGKALLACYRIGPKDVFIIASNSGVNPAIVDVASLVKEQGYALVALTSLDHSQRMTSRHSSGKKLYELADIVIDNCGPYGDALLTMPNGGKACSISSLTGALIGQMITAETIGNLLARGIQPPVYLSANVPGGIESGQKLRERYAGRTHI